MTYTVDTPRSRRRFRWPRLPLGEGQAAWTTRALMLLAPLLSFTLVEYLNYNNPWTDFTSLQIALNLAWYYLGELFFYFVLRRRALPAGRALHRRGRRPGGPYSGTGARPGRAGAPL